MRKLIIPILTTTLAACGGSSSGGAGSNTKQVYRPDGTVQGIVTDAVVVRSSVDIYRYTEDGKKELLAEPVTTDDGGRYEQAINSDDTYILVESGKGTGSYTEEFSGKVIQLNNQHVLKAIGYYTSGSHHDLIPNPWSNVAAGYVECRIKEGLNLPNAVAESHDLMSALVGIPVTRTYPINPTWTENKGISVIDDGIKFGALAAGISKLTYDLAVEQGVEPHEPGFTSIDFAMTMYNDIKNDCKLDGIGLTPDGRNKMNLGFGNRHLDAHVYRTLLPRKILEFMRSEKNLTLVDSEDLVLYVNTLASSTADVWGKAQPLALDDKGPQLEHNLKDQNFVHGYVDINVNAIDLAGVEYVKLFINGEEKKVVSGRNSSLGFASIDYQDGPIEITFETKDRLNNITSESLILNVQNTKPITRVTSPFLVKDEKYLFEMEVENLPQGVKSVEVEGNKAEYKNGKVKVELYLTQGYNELNIKLIDTMDQEYPYRELVFLDITPPHIDLRVPSLYPEEQMQVLYLPEGAKEPIMRPFKLSPDESIYVARDRRTCNGIQLNEDNLKALNWGYVVISPMDIGKYNENEPTQHGITVKYSYQIGDEVRVKEREGAIRQDGRYLVAFCEEFFGKDWWQVNDRGGMASLTFHVTDEAGNLTETKYDFKFTESATTFEPKLGENVFVGSGNNQIYFEAEGVEGIERADLYIDGVYVGSIADFGLGLITVPVEEFEEGLHEAHFVLFDNGREVYRTEPTKFQIDKTPPTPELVGQLTSGKARHVVEFTMDDDKGAGFDPDSLVVVNYAFNDQDFRNVIANESGTYSIVVDLVPGENRLAFTYSDFAGNENRVVFREVGYDVSAPAIDWQYPYQKTLVFGYNEDSVNNKIIKQKFHPVGTSYPLYLNEDMINLKPTKLEDFANYRLPDTRRANMPYFVLSLSDPMDYSEWGFVYSKIVEARYEVRVGGVLVHEADIKKRFEKSGVIGVNRQDLGDDFYQTNETVQVKVIVTDAVGHKSESYAEFKVHFEPNAPLITSFIHTDSSALSSVVGMQNVASLNRAHTTHNFKVHNPHEYPILVRLEDQKQDSLKAEWLEGQKVNKYRSLVHFERTLASGYDVNPGGHQQSGYIRKAKVDGANWSREQVSVWDTAGNVAGMDAHALNSNATIEGDFQEAFKDTPEQAIKDAGYMMLNSKTDKKVILQRWKRRPNCHDPEPDRCWERVSDKEHTAQGLFQGYYLRVSEYPEGKIKVREVTNYETAAGFPKPRIEQKNAAYLPTGVELTASVKPIKINKEHWYSLEPGESLLVRRVVNIDAPIDGKACNWVYEKKTQCLKQLNVMLGGAINVVSSIRTLNEQAGNAVIANIHSLDPIQLNLSR